MSEHEYVVVLMAALKKLIKLTNQNEAESVSTQHNLICIVPGKQLIVFCAASKICRNHTHYPLIYLIVSFHCSCLLNDPALFIVKDIAFNIWRVN